MIVTYSKEVFKHRILDRTKKHTIREDKSRRWKAGRSIEHWLGNPRNKKHNPDIHQFGKDVCQCVQAITIVNSKDSGKMVYVYDKTHTLHPKRLSVDQIEILAINDGFDNTEDFWNWFSETTSGYIIHWTDLIY